MSVVVPSNPASLCAPKRNSDMAIKSEADVEEEAAGETGRGGVLKASRAYLPPCVKDPEDPPSSGDKEECAVTQQRSKAEQPDAGLQSGGNSLSGRSDSDDEEEVVSLVLSDDSGQCVTEDESHYITTHEIELSELSDHEGDFDLGVGSSTSWDIEDDRRVYSFVDYTFDADGAARARGASAGVSTLRESDPSDPFPSSDENTWKPQQLRGDGGGQICLSIRATSRAINDPGNIQEQENILYRARRSGDVSRYVFRGVDGKAETLCDGAKCFIAAPGRMHFGGKLRGKKEVTDSSGTSSAVSELDDADKEVRNLTARAFKSLAYPYFDTINFSTSSESSASEHGRGLSRWSTFVDLKYGNVNVSQGLDQSVVSCQQSAASFEIANSIDNRGYKGLALAHIKPPTSKIFSISGSPRGASSSTQKIQLMGKFGQSSSGLIRLTETLNFRCNVKAGMSGGERRTKSAQNPAGSRSTDEVTNSLLRSQDRGASKPPLNAMEDMQKKSVFASSLIKNVLSKKIQFEQERKMERGEISEQQQQQQQRLQRQQAPSPLHAHHGGPDSHGGKQGSRDLRSQSSRLSESSSDCAPVCVEQLGDFVDSGSCDSRSSHSWRKDPAARAPETNLASQNEAGIDTKKGALGASRSTLLRSQNSAFRCWKDGELEFQKDHKNAKTLEDRLPSADEGEGDQGAARGKLTKMSHLFVPSIQRLSDEEEDEGGQVRRGDPSDRGDNTGTKLRADSTFYLSESRNASASKSPEIKINLRSVRDDKSQAFGVSKRRAPILGSKAPSLSRADDFKCQALAAALKGESSDKVPHFTVRDIRENKGKLQTPIHQVRDVRKLVKSSYHFVSVENSENKPSSVCADGHSEQRKHTQPRNPDTASPIVIKCQSVNTNYSGKHPGNVEPAKQESLDSDKVTLGDAKSDPPQRAGGPTSHSSSEENPGPRAETQQKPERGSELADKRPESKLANQVALEKLQAAVKTMEQLYVFEKNEWKRKSEPEPLTDSHVLSLITSEELGGADGEDAGCSHVDMDRRDSYPRTAASPGSEGPGSGEANDPFGSQPSSSHDKSLPSKSHQAINLTSSRNTSDFKFCAAPSVHLSNNFTQTPFSDRNMAPKSPQLPVSVKISRKKEAGEWKNEERFHVSSSLSDNYLTIPVKSHPKESKQPPPADKTSGYSFSTQSKPTPPPNHQWSGSRSQEQHMPKTTHSSHGMQTPSPEIPPATIYHSLPLGMSPSQPQMYCFSPIMTPAPTLEPFHATQRKMLLDPTTGNYYLVDTPVQPATKRLFDPETGRYVDMPIPQPPMTPLPMPLPPMALSPGAYGQTYMIYPSFMPAPAVIPSRALVHSQMSVPSEAESAEKAASQHNEGGYMESPFYMSTGAYHQAASGGQQQGAAAGRPQQTPSAVSQPIISITSQQGPRIIAPPSFDGTTMSFVVEHR